MKLFVIGLLLVNSTVYIQARSMFSTAGITVGQQNGKWLCGQIECPSGTERCYVTQSNQENRSVLKQINICYGQNNQILARKETTTPIDPSNSINMSSISSAGTSSDFDVKKFNENMEREMNELQLNLAKMESGIQESMAQMQHDLGHMFA